VRGEGDVLKDSRSSSLVHVVCPGRRVVLEAKFEKDSGEEELVE
jgi:hypothetical protein